MRKLGASLIAALCVAALTVACTDQQQPIAGVGDPGILLAKGGGNSDACTTIQDGTLLDVLDGAITTGYDEFGYNYQAHLFNGRYCDSDRVVGGPYCDVGLVMKWNDAWLSNKSCDNDAYLDRHFGSNSYSGSGAWVTNHMSGECVLNGETRKWTYFVKIVAAPEGAYKDGGIWYAADGAEIGLVIWTDFAVIQRISNDPCYDEHGVLYLSPVGPGFGKFLP